MSYYDPYSGYSSYPPPQPSLPLYGPLYNPQPLPAPEPIPVSIPVSTTATQLFPSLKIGSKQIPNYVYIIICVACVLLILCIIASVVSASANIGPPTTKPTQPKPVGLNTTKSTTTPKSTTTSKTSTQSKDNTKSEPVIINNVTTTTTPPPTTTIPPLSIYCSDLNLTTLMNKYPYWTPGDRITMLNILSNVTNNKDTSITNDNIYKKLKIECEL